MTRQASGFSIFCLIAAIISLIYITTYHIWLRPYELSHYVTQFSSLYGLLFVPLLSFSAAGGLVSFFGNLFLRQIPSAARMLLLIIPIFPMDIVMTGVSGFSSLNSFVTDKSFKTSSIFCGITASFTISAPPAHICSNSIFITSLSGVS